MVLYVSFPTHLIENLFFSVKSTKKTKSYCLYARNILRTLFQGEIG